MYEEWKSLLLEAKVGDKTIKQEILERLRPLVISSIQRYYNRRDDYQELIQEGDLCILECIEGFKDDKGVYFLGYVKLQLRYLYLNKHKEKYLPSLNVTIGRDEKQEEVINTIPGDEVDAVDAMIRKETLKELIDSLNYLTERQRRVIELFYVDKKSITEIALIMDVKYRTVVNTKTRAIEILRTYLVNN